MRFLVTAGPTREFIDPVRFISNRSSGKMGYAIAAAARDRGHDVVLVSGPVGLPDLAYVDQVKVVSAEEMLQAVEARIEPCEVLVMAAAVADWRPASVSEQKMKKLRTSPDLHLVPTPDILQTIRGRKGRRVFIGFAAETAEVLAEARRKLESKGLDMIVANDVSQPDAGFDVDTNRVVFITQAGVPEAWPLMSKREVAERIVEWAEARSGHSAAPGESPAVAPVGAARITGQLNVACLDSGGGSGSRLAQQLQFIREIDRLKSVFRRTLLMNGSRYENDAEHSWHLAMMAILLREHANEPNLDLARVIMMVLVHDIVEIDAGDTYCYDDQGNLGKVAREQVAATRLFGMLPDGQRDELRALWEEFEARETAEARFAAALDRVQPLLHNYCTGGAIWKKHGVRSAKVRERNRHVEEGSRSLWGFAEAMIRDAVKRGYLEP